MGSTAALSTGGRRAAGGPRVEVYQLCEDGQLPHVRITNSIRIRPDDLQDFIESRVTIPETPRPHRRKQPDE